MHQHGPLNISESSWLAVPFLSKIHVPTLHTVRDPRAVIASLVQRGTFDDGPYGNWAMTFAPGIRAFDDPLHRAAMYWLTWNRKIDDQGPLAFVRLEEASAWPLFKVLRAAGHKTARADVEQAIRTTRPVNVSRRRPEAIDLEDLTIQLRVQIERQMARYGYEVRAHA